MFLDRPRVRAARSAPSPAPASCLHKTTLCAALLFGGAYGTMRVSCAQAAPESLQTRPGNTLNVHELSLLANAHYGNRNAVEGALSRGADVNAQDMDGRTALMLAADYNSGRASQVATEFKRLLTANGMTASTASGPEDWLFWYPHSAAELDSEPARYLLKEGAVQHVDPAMSIPVVIWRRTSGNTDVIQALIRQGADVNKQDREGRTALIHAARNLNTPALRLLLQSKVEVNAVDNLGMSALGYAAVNSNAEGVQALQAGGAVVGAHSADGPILLRYAVTRRDNAQLRVLLAQGADVNAQDSVGSPLAAAVLTNNVEAADLLIRHGANVNNGGQWSPMEISLLYHRERIAELLLKHGTNPNGQGSYGYSYFLEAATTGSSHLLQAFLDRGADVNAPDQQGSTPLIRAMLGSGGLFRFDHEDQTDDQATRLSGDTRQAGTLAVANLLLVKGANVNVSNKNGETPLIGAVKSRQVAVVRCLIEHGANVNMKTVQGITPLSWAVRYHDDATADVLRAAGAKE